MIRFCFHPVKTCTESVGCRLCHVSQLVSVAAAAAAAVDKAAATVDGVHTRNVTTAHTYKHTDHAVTHPLWRERD